ncbi:hypothetical protein R1flu_002228 [Riccia fluitans]|uniref:Uncharacterized protein n=1 Tax=Riccia fluitans TaxID=41844 RepID=A0ABD1Y5S7_9MARC
MEMACEMANAQLHRLEQGSRKHRETRVGVQALELTKLRLTNTSNKEVKLLTFRGLRRAGTRVRKARAALLPRRRTETTTNNYLEVANDTRFRSS